MHEPAEPNKAIKGLPCAPAACLCSPSPRHPPEPPSSLSASELRHVSFLSRVAPCLSTTEPESLASTCLNTAGIRPSASFGTPGGDRCAEVPGRGRASVLGGVSGDLTATPPMRFIHATTLPLCASDDASRRGGAPVAWSQRSGASGTAASSQALSERSVLEPPPSLRAALCKDEAEDAKELLRLICLRPVGNPAASMSSASDRLAWLRRVGSPAARKR